jgi:dihydropyrimidine dehydrogenase (NAD+) subunit PreT
MVKRRETKTLNRSSALLESRRCLGCHNPPCVDACPARVPIPDFIQRISEDNLQGAAELIYDACPLGHICGTACPTADLCEGSCVLLPLGERAVRIGALQAYATGNAEAPRKEKVTPDAPRVAVIGGGPAGLGAAVQLERLGVEVHLFERRRELGGQANSVIPEHHLPQAVVDHDISRIGFGHTHFHAGVNIDEILAAKLISEYKAVIVAIGQQASQDPGIPGDKSQGVFNALDYLARARTAHTREGTIPLLGSTIVVIGGGNVALDAAAVAKRNGAERVIVLYRRGLEEMPAWEYEYIEACALGVEFRWFSVADRIVSENGKVSGVTIGHMRYSEEIRGGRRWVEPDISKQPTYLDCDAVVLALGQSSELDLLRWMGIAENKGLAAVEKVRFQTTNPKVFAAGEIRSGGSSIVGSMASGMQAAREAHAWLVEEGIPRG